VKLSQGRFKGESDATGVSVNKSYIKMAGVLVSQPKNRTFAHILRK